MEKQSTEQLESYLEMVEERVRSFEDIGMKQLAVEEGQKAQRVRRELKRRNK